MTKKFIVLLFIPFVRTNQGLAAIHGYNRETGEIILPSDVSLYEHNSPSQKDLAKVQAAEVQHKALQEAAEKIARIQLWEKMGRKSKLRCYDKLVFEMRKNFDESRAYTNPFIGEQSYLIYPYGEVMPVCALFRYKS